MKMRSAEFIALSASTMMLTAFGIDVMLPAFSEVRRYFDLPPSSTATAQIISFFFMGQVAQLLFGIFSDRFGRLPILWVGFPLYIIAGVVAAFAPTIQIMFAARFVGGMGASAVFMTTIAAVRDRYIGDQMARIMSLIFTIFLFTPVLAPFLGMAILSAFSWKVVFLSPPIFAALVFVWSFRLEESLPKENRIALNWRDIGSSIRKVITNKIFLRYTTTTTGLFAVLSSYVATSEHIVGEVYGRPQLFAWIFGGTGLIMAMGTFINSRLASTFGARKTIRHLLIVYLIVAALLLLYTMIYGDPPKMSVFFVAIAALLTLNLAVEPNSSALALEPLGDMAGTASAVYGTCFFFIGSLIGTLVTRLMANGILPLIVAFFAVGLISVLLVRTDRRSSRSN